jgi:hypothetical protein
VLNKCQRKIIPLIRKDGYTIRDKRLPEIVRGHHQQTSST